MAAAMHFAARRPAETPSSFGLLLLTITYGDCSRRSRSRSVARPGIQRASRVALAAFAVSALHLSRNRATPIGYVAVELIGHHASLPLVLAILYQDYRSRSRTSF